MIKVKQRLTNLCFLLHTLHITIAKEREVEIMNYSLNDIKKND